MMRHPVVTALAALAAVVGGCHEKEATAPAAPSTKTVQKAPAAEPPKAEAPEFSYSPVGKRDPFYSYLADLESAAEAATQRKHEATEAFELDQYRLTLVVSGTAQPRAMVEDPEGKGHVIKIGSRLGKQGGVVTRITPEGVLVTQELRTPSGEQVRVPITIKLPQPELELGSDQ